MSKLFDTLEKIRENETYQPQDSSKKPVKRVKLPKNLVLIGTGLGVAVLAAVILFSNFPIKSRPPADKITENPVPKTAVSEQQIKTANAETGPTATAAVNTSPKSRTYTLETLQRWEEELAAEDVQSARQTILLNNIATYHIYHQQYWKGLSFLDRALQSQPGSIEMLVNYAVALTEMGFYGAAAKYFAKAYAIDPTHPALTENLAILKQTKIMDDRLASLYSGGDTIPRSQQKR